jgi:hypothetical protein
MPIQISDLSVGGCFIGALHEPPEKGRRISLNVELPDDVIISVDAITLESRLGFGYAVRFVDVPQETSQTLAEAITKVQESRKKVEESRKERDADG